MRTASGSHRPKTDYLVTYITIFLKAWQMAAAIGEAEIEPGPPMRRLNTEPGWPGGWGTMRRRILTKAVLATIPEMVSRRGMRARDIAETLGCKISTLKVRCSQAGISLRPPGSRRGRPRSDERAIRLNRAVLALLQNRAAASGKTEAALARELIETIARDNLYDAVLDAE
jgi:transposase-like protein